MAQSDGELRCTRCGKDFIKAASLKRHGYYCKTRPVGVPRSRKRCCDACTRSKIRCNGILPACSSCTSRGINCAYSLDALSNLAQPRGVSTTSSDSGDATSQELTLLEMDAGRRGEFDSNLFSSGFGGFDASSPSFELPFANFETIKTPPNPFASGFVAEELTRPMSPISLQPKLPRLMYQRRTEDANAQLAMTMIQQIICSFPTMMLQKETFPPFIHPAFWNCAPELRVMPDILQDCMGYAQMFVARTPESSPVLWRSIRMEQEKLISQYKSYSNAELQAAVQAILIYTCMRLVDGSPAYDGIEIPLLHTLNTISMHLALQLGGDEFNGALRHDERYWQQWLFAETRRRVVTTARIMNMAFSMDRAISCQALEGFALVPLPASKILWNAPDAETWRREFDVVLKERSIHGLTKSGKLVRLHQTAIGVETWDVGWERWYASQDQFGIMIMLTSKILQ